jgi:hypothetical protein
MIKIKNRTSSNDTTAYLSDPGPESFINSWEQYSLCNICTTAYCDVSLYPGSSKFPTV